MSSAKTKNYQAQHILVKYNYEAEDLLRKLRLSPEKFDLLASQFSICASASNAGHLGALKTGQADPDFEEACLNLKINEITKLPVRTKFGYHIIKRLG